MRFRLSTFAVALALAGAQSASATLFTVVNTDDGGLGSLRAAIEGANGMAGPHDIEFNIPGAAPHTISLLSALPDLQEPMTIDATTQPGASANTNPLGQGLNTVIGVALDGTAVPGASVGLSIAAAQVTIRGLAIYGFFTQIAAAGTGPCFVLGNFIGTDPTGTSDPDPDMANGVVIQAPLCDVGGTAPADRNLISGNYIGVTMQNVGGEIRHNLVGTDISGTAALPNDYGIHCNPDEEAVEMTGNVVSGNRELGLRFLTLGTNGRCTIGRNIVGLDVTGTLPLGNGGTGILVFQGAHNIGGATDGNVVAANGAAGISIRDNAEGASVVGNWIGTDDGGNLALGNGGNGVDVDNSVGVEIGGTNAGQGNTIRSNAGIGVSVFGGDGIEIIGNRIFENGGLGVDLGNDGVTSNDAGDGDIGPANSGQNFPEVEAEVANGMTTVSITLDGAVPGSHRIELYANTFCDPSGFGEAETALAATDVVADGNGDLATVLVIGADLTGQSLTAIATDPNGNSSELSRCFDLLGPSVVEVPTTSPTGAALFALILIAAAIHLSSRARRPIR